ncbi:PAQR family membrane homeostasis protein TrhA [Ureibacillus aquaedulcis]|uniref:Hemolysin III family protein n=1 Tax=Ureibacillus aquaedulcis TaxID=3058421 RepID=A0ABT8GMN5_9BACL|nr:hemolysin III family protein [Ureibacillus sp. BA0131]MDN4492683.1 hemolysin III family protein [Ureibacillus sp. BA0131]
MNTNEAFDYKNWKEELWNAITHGIGLFISIPTCVILILLAVQKGSAIQIVSYSVFGGSLVLLFLMSTLLHSMPEKYKRFFSILDHSSIYILIAGSYTPFLLIAIDGALGIVLLSIIWTIAVFGVVFKCLFIHKFETFSLILYIAMGWLIIFAIKPLYEFLQFDGFTVLLSGGLLFTFGAVFYAWRKLPYNHAIWHLFVIGGCACLVICVAVYL